MPKCNKCGGDKDRITKSGLRCRACDNAYRRERYAANPKIREQITIAGKLRRVNHPENIAEWHTKNRDRLRAYHTALRETVLHGYGDKCACCGETEPLFLAIDHVNGGGGHARKTGIERNQQRFLRHIIAHQFPPAYRLLCHNCNMATRFGQTCPHEDRI